MPATMPSSLMRLSGSNDPKQALLDALGSAVDSFRVMGQQVLVGTYIEPEKTAGNIIKPQSYIQESLYMGTLGLVLKLGPWAFQNDPELNIDWKGQTVEVGEWAMFKYSDAWEFHLNGVSVRLIDDRSIKGVVPTPLLLTSKQTLKAMA